MPESCSRQALAITTSASRAVMPWSLTTAGCTPRRSSSRKSRSATFRTICTCTHEWSDMPSRSAFVCCTTHHALSWSSALAASSRAWSFLLPRAGARTRMSATASRGVSATARTLSAEQSAKQIAPGARIDAVLALVPAPLGLVRERQHELLAGGAEVAGNAVEAVERRVLEEPGHAAPLRQLARLAWV